MTYDERKTMTTTPEADRRFIDEVWNPASLDERYDLLDRDDIPLECLIRSADGDDHDPDVEGVDGLIEKAQSLLSRRPVVTSSFYVPSPDNEELTNEFHIVVSPVPDEDLWAKLDDNVPLEGLAFGYRRIWEDLGDEFEVEEAWGWYDLASPQWSQGDLCGGPYDEPKFVDEVLKDLP